MTKAKPQSEPAEKQPGFNQVGTANGIPIYVSGERSNFFESKKRLSGSKLVLVEYRVLLSGFNQDDSLGGKFNYNGKTDTNFWISGIGKDINHVVSDSQGPEITISQELEIVKLAESGMSHADIAQKLNIVPAGVYYALKHKGAKRTTRTKKPPTSILCTFDKEGNLVPGKGDSTEDTVRVARGLDDEPLLFFVLRDSYSRVGGARFVLAACNGRQFTAAFMARTIVGVPKQ